MPTTNDITAVMVQDADGRENVYIPLGPLVEELGLTWASQIIAFDEIPF